MKWKKGWKSSGVPHYIGLLAFSLIFSPHIFVVFPVVWSSELDIDIVFQKETETLQVQLRRSLIPPETSEGEREEKIPPAMPQHFSFKFCLKNPKQP